MGAGGENIAPVPIEDNIKKVPISKPLGACRGIRNRTRWPTIRRGRPARSGRSMPTPRWASAGGSVQRHVGAAVVAVPQSHAGGHVGHLALCDGEAV